MPEEPEQVLPQQRRPARMSRQHRPIHHQVRRQIETRSQCRSEKRSTAAASKTLNASSVIIAVTNHDHTVSGMRIRLMPSHRDRSTVVMKFTADINDAKQK